MVGSSENRIPDHVTSLPIRRRCLRPVPDGMLYWDVCRFEWLLWWAKSRRYLQVWATWLYLKPGKNLQKFVCGVEQLAHKALRSPRFDLNKEEAAHTFIGGAETRRLNISSWPKPKALVTLIEVYIQPEYAVIKRWLDKNCLCYVFTSTIWLPTSSRVWCLS